MTRHRAAAALAIAALSLIVRLAGGQTQASGYPGAHDRRPLVTMAEIATLNGLVWGYDRFGMEAEWARISTQTWIENVVSTPEWDNDSVTSNLLGHPIHGAIYFNTARSNGYAYWESYGFALLGSAAWEWFGENYRPSPGDLINTSVGGAALGEALRRLSGALMTSGRLPRSVTGAASAVMDPALALNRRLGSGGIDGPELPGSIVTAYRTGVDGGIGHTAGALTPFVAVDVQYGFLATDPVNRPFDVMRFGLTVGGGSTVSRIHSQGALAATVLDPGRTAIGLFQHFDYLSSPALEFGAQSICAGLVNRRRLGRRLHLTTAAQAGIMLLGTTPSLFVDGPRRHMDYGPGAVAKMETRLGSGRVEVLRAWVDAYLLRGVVETAVTHVAVIAGIEVNIPLPAGLTVGASLECTGRASLSSVPRDPSSSAMRVRLSAVWRLGG